MKQEDAIRLFNFLSYEKTVNNINEIKEYLPSGWKSLVRPLEILTTKIPGYVFLLLRVDKGILRIIATHGNVELDDLFLRVRESVARDTAVTCMWCGSLGRRHKKDEGMPSFCRPHYIEYLNLLNESGILNVVR
jgi:hypothetical protein